MNYRNLADLAADLFLLGSRLPADLDLIVGVPRSGLLAAQILALYRNLPLTDVEGLITGRVIESGPRGEAALQRLAGRPRAKVLVLDDSLWSGGQLAGVRRRIGSADLSYQVSYAAAYVIPGAESQVDFFCDVVSLPRVFEWNVLHHSALNSACVDLDGILCRDPDPAENDDGPEYRRFLQNVLPTMVPRERIGAIVTARLEKYRPETEHWLERHGIRYNRLVMLSGVSAEARAARRPHAAFKARYYRRHSEHDLFIESSLWQAKEILVRAGKPVLCWETRELITDQQVPAPSSGRQTRFPFRRTLGRLLRALRRRGAVGAAI